MIRFDCIQAQPRVEDLIDGYLPAGEAAALRAHLAACNDCAQQHRAREALRAALREMPVPAVRAEFADAALAAAVHAGGRGPAATAPPGKPSAARPPRRFAWRRRELWLGASLGAAAAAAGLVLVLWNAPAPEVLPDAPLSIRLALHEPRDIDIAIDAREAMPGATLTVALAGGIDLVGFGERRELQWEADLDAGTNVLTLPIVAYSMEEGLLTAHVAHGEQATVIRLQVHVEAPAPGAVR